MFVYTTINPLKISLEVKHLLVTWFIITFKTERVHGVKFIFIALQHWESIIGVCRVLLLCMLCWSDICNRWIENRIVSTTDRLLFHFDLTKLWLIFLHLLAIDMLELGGFPWKWKLCRGKLKIWTVCKNWLCSFVFEFTAFNKLKGGHSHTHAYPIPLKEFNIFHINFKDSTRLGRGKSAILSFFFI